MNDNGDNETGWEGVRGGSRLVAVVDDGGSWPVMYNLKECGR